MTLPVCSAACDSMTELVCAVANRLGGDFDPDNPPSIMVCRPSDSSCFLKANRPLCWLLLLCLLSCSGRHPRCTLLVFLLFLQYDDEEGDKVVISVDDDLAAAVKFAKACSLKVREQKVESYNGAI